MPPQIYINPTCSFSLPFFIPSSARCSLLAKCFPERNETTLIHGSYSSNNINFDLPSEFPGTLTSLNEREYAANLVQVDLILCEFVLLSDFLIIWIFFNRVIQNVHSLVHCRIDLFLIIQQSYLVRQINCVPIEHLSLPSNLICIFIAIYVRST